MLAVAFIYMVLASQFNSFVHPLTIMTALPLRLPGCKSWSDWFGEVAFPAFETKLQRVYERKG